MANTRLIDSGLWGWWLRFEMAQAGLGPGRSQPWSEETASDL